MSGRYSLFSWPQSWPQLAGFEQGWPQRWNLSPQQPVTLLHLRAGQQHLSQALWGFTPSWSKQLDRAMPHARAEEVMQKKVFADALANRRGVLPANGFFEWRGKTGTIKQPYWLSSPQGLLYMAALWEPYQVYGAQYLSAAMLTVQAAYLRRPLLISEQDLSLWLDPATPMQQIEAWLAAPQPVLQERRVTTWVNDPAADGPECIQPQSRMLR